jgi:alkylation response protein AidB-like acyl-CoA dehydrogenase
MVPMLRKQALQAERDRLIAHETHKEFQDAGFYRLLQPARYGGYEMPIRMMVEVAAEIVFAHDMASNSAAITPLLKADTATLTFSASKDGKLRATYAEWDDARACASGAMVERGGSIDDRGLDCPGHL